MTAPIEAIGLARRFGDVEAVAGVDLTVAEGEVLGFLGPNGAGKSTCVRMLTTLLKPSGGTARVAGFDVVSQADAVRRSIGVALQDAAIDPLMTGHELLRLQATLHGIPRSELRRKSDELLERVGLTAAGDRRVGTYSGGMRRRLDLAASLVASPEVLFLDEPTTGLDPLSRNRLWETLERLIDGGTAVVLTTQYLDEADRLADEIVLIDHGRCVAQGTPSDLKRRVAGDRIVVTVEHDAAIGRGLDALAPVLDRIEVSDAGDRTITGSLGGTHGFMDVARVLADASIDVHDIERRRPTLDDVFLAYTSTERSPS